MKTIRVLAMTTFCSVACLGLLAQTTCQAADKYVVYNGAGAMNGSSWTDAEDHIQHAIASCAASGGGTVYVLGYLNSSSIYTEHVNMVQGVSVVGGCTGTNNETSPDSYITAISASGVTPSDCVIYFPSGVTTATSISGCTITAGSGRDVSGIRKGGGIYCEGSPTISHCHITANSATYGAGIMAVSGTTPVIDNNIIENNTTSGATAAACYGVGIYMYGGTCSYNVIQDNKRNSSHGCYGGGIYLGSYASATLTLNTIASNGIVDDVQASSGGGISCSYATSTITYNTIDSNKSRSAGGVYLANPSTSGSFAGNKVNLNEAVGSYGGVYLIGTGRVYSNQITNNTAGSSGGGIGAGAFGPNAKVVNNTIVDNTATTGSGGGLYVTTSYNSGIVANNIFTGNSPSAIHKAGNYTYSCSTNCMYDTGDHYTGGQPTAYTEITEDPDLDAYYHIIDSTSPCVDAGDDSQVVSTWKDCDGQPRQVDIPNVGTIGTKVDIGADEYYPDYTTTPLVNRDLPSSNVNEDAGANRCNFRWAGSTSSTIGYGDDFQLYAGPSWVIYKIVVWVVPDVPVSPSYYLSDYYDDVALYMSDGQSGALTLVKSASFSGDGTSDQYVQVTPTDYGSSTGYQCSDGTYNQIWKIEFSNLSKTISANGTVYFGVIGTPKVDRLWFNHATHGLADGTIREFDTTSLSSTTAVSNVSWFGKDGDINVQVYASPQ